MTDRDAEVNAEQIRFWNEVGGPRWVQRQQMFDAQIGELGLAAIDAAGVGEGEAVLDVGCGCGTSTMQLAERVGPGGRVVGLDVSAPMLALARRRAGEARVDNVRFQRADAQVCSFTARFDVLYSRFGVMFFEDPAAAFANMRRGLRRGGRLAFVCWQPMMKNPWMALPLMAVLRHVAIETPASPHAPGPFAFGDGARVEDILARAGFHDAALQPLECDIRVAGGASVDEAVGFVLELGPVERALADAAPETRQAVVAEVRQTLAAHAGADGVRMRGAAWIVTAVA